MTAWALAPMLVSVQPWESALALAWAQALEQASVLVSVLGSVLASGQPWEQV